LAGFALATVAVAVGVGNYLAVPFLLLYAGGYGYIGLHGLRDVWASRYKHPQQPNRAPAVADSQIK
jgi:hypothetical protein